MRKTRTPLSLDTRPEAERVYLDLVRRAPPHRRLNQVGQMNHAVRLLALSGLRQRHPHTAEAELHRRLADLWLGPELAGRVYPAAPWQGDRPMLPDPIAVTLLVIDKLDALHVPYFLGGSLASAVHGVLRTTMDADLVADLRPEHAGPLASALSPAFYVDASAIRDAIRHQSSFNAIHLETMFKVDVFVLKPRPFDRAQFERRAVQVVERAPERTAYVASAEDTILAKLEWYRLGGEVSERQWRDVVGVLNVQSDRLDYTYLRAWAGQLNVADLLERAFAEAGSNQVLKTAISYRKERKGK